VSVLFAGFSRSPIVTDALYLKPSMSTSRGTEHRALRPFTTQPCSGKADVSTLSKV